MLTKALLASRLYFSLDILVMSHGNIFLLHKRPSLVLDALL